MRKMLGCSNQKYENFDIIRRRLWDKIERNDLKFIQFSKFQRIQYGHMLTALHSVILERIYEFEVMNRSAQKFRHEVMKRYISPRHIHIGSHPAYFLYIFNGRSFLHSVTNSS